MASTTTTIISPPPTTNKLDAMQRARVMRYSRKLGAVLGTTPFLLESCGSTVPATLYPASRHNSTRSHSKRHHRQRFDFDDQPRASSESLPVSLSPTASSSNESLLSTSESSVESSIPVMLTTKSLHPGATPRPLIFLDTVSVSSSDTPHVHATPRVTRTPSSDVPPTPTTPKQLSNAEARRRKMARVMRTLGEKVPPELVFQASDKDGRENHPVSNTMLLDTRPVSRTRSTSSTTKNNRRRSASVGSSTQWQRLLDLPAPVFSSSAKAPDDQRWVGEWNRRNIAQVQRELRALR